MKFCSLAETILNSIFAILFIIIIIVCLFVCLFVFCFVCCCFWFVFNAKFKLKLRMITEKFEDTKGVNRSRISKEDRQYNVQKDKQWTTKNYTEN